jgi:hypothetical protein
MGDKSPRGQLASTSARPEPTSCRIAANDGALSGERDISVSRRKTNVKK